MASFYPSAWLDELRARSDIVQVISGYVPLQKKGRKHWGLCPFHGEKTASFSVDAERQLYYCFGCKAGGNVISFIMDMERLSFPEAVEHLAERAHMPLPEMEKDEDYERRRTQRERLLNANRAAARFYHETLFTPDGADVLAYLRGRGLSDGVIRRFGLGAAPNDWTRLTDRLREEGFSLEELQQVNLTSVKAPDPAEGRTRTHIYDVFRNRAMFPIIDAYGNVIAFGGRTMEPHPQGQKYVNTSDTPVFNKRKNIYAANLLRKQRKLERVILVEGYMDVISLAQFGVEGVCATLGTALTEEQAHLIHRFAPQVYLGYDGDAAGQKAILRGLEIFEKEGVPVRVLDFPDGLDPDEFIRRDGAEGFRALPAIPPATFRLRRLKDTMDLSTEDGRERYAQEAAKILALLEPVERERYMRELSVQTGFPRETLMAQIRVSAAAAGKLAEPAASGFTHKAPAPDEPASDSRKAEETLISILATGQIPEDLVEEKDFEDDELKWIYGQLVSGASPASLMDRVEDEVARSRYTRMLLSPPAQDKDELIAMAQDCVNALRRIRIDRRMEEITQALQNASPEESGALLRESMELRARRQKYERHAPSRL